MCNNKCVPARLDPNGTEKPKTKLVARVRPGVCFGPGATPESWELRNVTDKTLADAATTVILDEVDPATPELLETDLGLPRK